LIGLGATMAIGAVVYTGLIAILDRGAFKMVRDAVGKK
jgi:hypothetical protein